MMREGYLTERCGRLLRWQELDRHASAREHCDECRAAQKAEHGGIQKSQWAILNNVHYLEES